MARITPFLWFNGDVREIVAFYTAIFPGSAVGQDKMVAGEGGGPWEAGRVVTQEFELAGQRLIAFAGGPQHQFNDAISLSVACEDQAEIDRLWEALLEDGGSPIACGWLKDKYGLRWQIVPKNIAQLLSKPGALQAMMGMTKMDWAELERAGGA